MPGLRKCILWRRYFLWANNTDPTIPFKIDLEINGALFHRLLSVTADSEAYPKETAPPDWASLMVPLGSGAELEGYLPTFAKGKWMQTLLVNNFCSCFLLYGCTFSCLKQQTLISADAMQNGEDAKCGCLFRRDSVYPPWMLKVLCRAAGLASLGEWDNRCLILVILSLR